jgi:uncharacterized protein YbaA (DUF1428 family)
MAYVDGFVLPVPTDKIEAYREISTMAGRVWKEYGALAYYECVADDVKSGEHTSFPQAVQLAANETVVFAWILFRSREHRDEVNAKVMKDPRMNIDPQQMPVDMKRMIYGGFKTIVEL